MPWGAVQTPSLALAILKTSVESAGFTPELHFLNIRFAELLGLTEYEAIASRSFFHAEWFFSQALFGPMGMGELRNDWSAIQSSVEHEDLVKTLIGLTGGAEERCASIAQDSVPRFIDACLSEIDWSRYTAVGFSTTFAQSLSSLLLARHIRGRWPEVKIIFGGANVDSEMGVEFLRSFEWIDYVVHGEAEKSLPLLLDAIAAGSDSRTPGVSMRRNGQVLRGDQDATAVLDLNESPIPDYSAYVDCLSRSGFRNKIPLALYYESSRGCWWGAKHHCTFCGLNGSNMNFRAKSAERVYTEIVELSDKYRCLKLNAADNILSMEHLTRLLPALAELDTDIEFFYEVKANLTRRQLKTLHDAGVRTLQPGIESFHSRLLRLMNKGVSAIQNVQLLKWCSELGILLSYNVLYGFPGETADDYAGLPDLFQLLSHLQPPGTVSRIMFERFSPYHSDSARFSLALKPSSMYRQIFPEQRVRLDRIAYFFDGTWQGQTQNPEEYIAATVTAWRAWEAAQQKRVFCCYVKGPNYITIYDNRILDSSSSMSTRCTQLDERSSAIYLFCDENRTLRGITEMINRRFSLSLSEADVGCWVEDLVSRKLMFREADRYLSLAIRGRPGKPIKPTEP